MRQTAPAATIALLLASVLCICAQEQPLTGWTYSFTANPLSDEWADPGFLKLTDGSKDPAGSAILSGGTIAIEVDLARTCRLTRLVAQVHRHNDNYKLRRLSVEALQAGQYVAAGENTGGFWGPTEQSAFALEVPLEVTTDRLRVVFEAASIVSIQEIELYGTPAEAEVGSRLYEQLPFSDAAGAHVSEVDADGDGAKEIVLENPLVRLVFQPDGGVCRSFVLKEPNVEFVGGTGRYGMLRDQLWEPRYVFADRLYFAETGQDDTGAWVELRSQGVGGMLSFTHMSKRVHLRADSPVVRVHYTLTNDPSSQTDYAYGLWAHHFLGGGERGATYFFPTTQGVVEERCLPGEELEVWHRNPSRGWTALVGEDGVGLAATMDYRALNCFYMWSGVGTRIPTLEWRYNRVPVRAGESFETDMTFLPLEPATAPRRVDAVLGNVVGAIEAMPGPQRGVAVSITRPEAGPRVTGTVQVRGLPDGDWEPLLELELEGAGASLSNCLVLEKEGMDIAVRCLVSQEGEQIGSFERGLSRTGEPFALKMDPESEQIGDSGAAAAKALPGHELSTEVETPHFPWAKPYYKGPVRALVLCDDRYSREVIELWQRLEMDFEYVKFMSTLDKEWLWHGDRSILTLEAAQARLAEKLKSDYDVIVLGALKWDHHFTPELRQTIAEKVRAGTGLVYIEPDGTQADDELEGVCGVADSESRSLNWWGKWEPVAEHSIVSGLPWDIMPRTRRMPYVTQPQGEALATVTSSGGEQQPLIVAGQLGQGRVVSLTYDTLTHIPGYRGYSALTPAISYRGNYNLVDEMRGVTWQYWEHWWALLCRCATWAAHKDADIRFESLAADLQTGKLTGRLVGEVPEGAQVEVIYRDRFSAEVARGQAALGAGQEATTITAELPESLRAGRCFADLVLRDSQRASIAWAATSFAGPDTLAFRSIAVGEKTVTAVEDFCPAGQPWQRRFRATEPFRLDCEVALQLPVTELVTVSARLTDSHGRLLAAQIRPVTADTGKVSFEAAPEVLYNCGYRWEVELTRGETVCDTDHAEFIVVPPYNWDRFTFTSWGGQYLWRCQYLFDFVRPRVEALGLDVAMNGSNEIGTGKVWWDYWQNIEHSYMGVLSYVAPGVPDFMDANLPKKAAEYAKTHDKSQLVREPCLHDPEYLSKLRDGITTIVMPRIAQFGRAYDYCMGDEMSLTHYTRYFDYCFGEHTLAAFRTWLQGRYETLETLNAEWETDFAAWDAVMPMTLDEVKGRANAAPWAEFRDFMNDTLAEYYTMVQDTIRRTDPQAQCGLSGTQEPKPGNGMDWWQNSGAFSYYHSYNTGWSDEMRRSFASATGVSQSPYRCGYWQDGRRLEYQMFWCLLHDTKGISAWTTPLLFYGDFTTSQAGKDTQANVLEMKAGIWDLLRSAGREHDGIAIHYSHPSINAALLVNKDTEIKDVRDGWVKLIEDLGLQYDFLSYQQVESGALNPPSGTQGSYRVLILPESLALSPAETEQIKRFVRSGGAVIGDVAVGIMDDKCRRQSPGMLDEVFGIRRVGEETALPLGIAVEGAEGRINMPAGEAGVRCAQGAAALGHVVDTEVPALIRHEYGEGRAVYLNLNLSNFENERRFGTPSERLLRDAVMEALSWCGVERRYPIAAQSGAAPHVELVRYSSGPLEYLGLLADRDDEEPTVARIALRRPCHAYDVRAGRYIGQIEVLTAPLEPGECRVYCLSQAPLGTAALTVDNEAKPGGALAYRLTPRPGAEGERALWRVTLLGPNGKAVGEYARNILLAAEPVDGTVHLALNDPAGTWRLQARCLCTGEVLQREVEVGG